MNLLGNDLIYHCECIYKIFILIDYNINLQSNWVVNHNLSFCRFVQFNVVFSSFLYKYDLGSQNYGSNIDQFLSWRCINNSVTFQSKRKMMCLIIFSKRVNQSKNCKHHFIDILDLISNIECKTNFENIVIHPF